MSNEWRFSGNKERENDRNFRNKVQIYVIIKIMIRKNSVFVLRCEQKIVVRIYNIHIIPSDFMNGRTK